MATNPYFSNFQVGSEQNLIEDLIIEAIQIHGTDVYYLPRALQKEDLIFGEDTLSKFEDCYEIEIYLKSVDGFQGEGDILRKFGMDVNDEATIVVSRTRFDNTVGTELIRPKEGDLILFPLNGAIFEIKFVTNESIFYQLGEFYVYEMKIEQYVYSHEDFKTGIDEVDSVANGEEYAQAFNMVLGSGAGDFVADETVYQGVDPLNPTAQAEVVEWNVTPNTLKIRDIVGKFDINQPIVGLTSGATYDINEYDKYADVNDPIERNSEIENEAKSVLDFTETNPFCEDEDT